MDKAELKPKKTRRARGEGSIRYIPRIKKYEVRYSVGKDENGKTVPKTFYSEKMKDALAVMRDDLAAVGRGIYVDPSLESLYSCCLNWYEIYKEPELDRINTKKKYAQSLTRLKKALISNTLLKDLSTELIQKYYNELKRSGLKEATIKITHTLINGALTHAKKTKKITENYALDVIIPKDDVIDDEEGEARALTDAQLEEFLHEMEGSVYYMYALFTVKTGLRPGEAVALLRPDLFFDVNKVKVAKTYVKEAKNKVQGTTKTQSSKRTVPVPSGVMHLMKAYMLSQKNQSKTASLFQTLNGTMMSPRNILRQYKAAGERIGCEWVNLHTMRHTFASKLFKEKVDIKIISKLLGHKDVSTTYNIYVHFIDNVVEESVQILNEGVPEKLPQKADKNKKDNVSKLRKAN